MKRMILGAALLMTAAHLLPAQDAEPAADAKAQRLEEATETAGEDWGAKLGEVPELLRMHMPMLPGNTGLVIESVELTGPAGKIGVRAGDIVVDVDGRMIRDKTKLGRLTDRSVVTVFRRGVLKKLPCDRPTMSGGRSNLQAFPSMPPMQSIPNTKSVPNNRSTQSRKANSFGSGAWSSAISSSSQGEAISVSRAGDQVSVDISSTDPNIGQIKLSGTIAEIEEELRGSKLSAEAKAAIRQAIRD
ncbi:hypothetical protein LF1_51670 [Rubripirellula obstinata]|uniref:PDZ domain-containing protein n=1 Tax=Rubripirellula obstinata TaxID=406547 RepID=A0A5B1CSD3_9BACT|nr:PDZ domain-containing protein [Rubripirellula obstinata]KAA1262600.1 hypothetical protein LF1_51670 [Rubripirellula obstinata]